MLKWVLIIAAIVAVCIGFMVEPSQRSRAIKVAKQEICGNYTPDWYSVDKVVSYQTTPGKRWVVSGSLTEAGLKFSFTIAMRFKDDGSVLIIDKRVRPK